MFGMIRNSLFGGVEVNNGTLVQKEEKSNRLKPGGQVAGINFVGRLQTKSGVGKEPKKRPYLYTAQLQFLRPVMDLRLTVDSLDAIDDSETAGSEKPAVFSPATSPAPTPAEEPEELALAQPALPMASPERGQQPQPRRRRHVPLSSSGQENCEMIDAQVIEFLAQRRSDGLEEAMLRGLGPLMKQITPEKYHECLASLALVIKMCSSPYQGDI
ncbi:heme-binding protein 1 isoform X1 [Bufo gargarizans]|uniref:heme-binding protein 1 isoform X1 n=1 Tax=Bufo gargarizans TaxID=30331 RepID=UPI001CF59870|nr:heme-binding protein 1 isoform X1 [Bufo gargarizans]